MYIRAKFFTTTSDALDQLKIEDGNIISIKNENRWCYDMDGIRHSIGSNLVVTDLPSNGQENILYIVNNENSNTSGLYIYG